MTNTMTVTTSKQPRTEKANIDRPLEAYPPVLQARHIRDILGISEAKAYEVLNSRKCPTIHMGKRMVVMKDSFIQYLYASQGASLLEEGGAC